MSNEITTAFVSQFKTELTHLVQQKGSRLRGSVRNETLTGEKGFFEQLGLVEAQTVTTRHADTPIMDTPHARRLVIPTTYNWGDLIDRADLVRTLIDPTSPYLQAGSWALGRKIDDVIIAAADAAALTGADGTTSTAFDTANIVDVQVGETFDVGLNTKKLMAAKDVLDANDVDPEDARFLILNSRQLQNLLQDTEVRSSDFNTVKALVQGDIDTFLGFTFIRSERIGTDSNSDDKVLFWAQQGMLLATNEEPTAMIGPRPDKRWSTQVFYEMVIGATRMQEKMVGYIECDPTLFKTS